MLKIMGIMFLVVFVLPIVVMTWREQTKGKSVRNEYLAYREVLISRPNDEIARENFLRYARRYYARQFRYNAHTRAQRLQVWTLVEQAINNELKIILSK